jgi:hemolysin activation/secretion protein
MLIGLVYAGPGAAQEARFDVFEYRVEGATLLPVLEVERAVYPHLGEGKLLADVEAAREALEQAYHRAGYLTVLVSIPQQKVDRQVVRLAVTEAPVDRLRVVESRYFSLGAIKAGAPELAEGKVPHFPQMQSELAALNRSPDRRVTPVLRPGRTPGSVEVDLKVQDRLPLHGSIELDDRASQDTSRSRLQASVRYDNLWQRQHSLGLTLQTAPQNPRESQVVSANYTWPLASGRFLSFYGVRSDSDVAAVGTLNVVGKGTVLGARYIVPLPGREGFFHTASFGVDHKDFDQSVNLIGSGGFNTPITYMPFMLGWDGTWLGEKSNTRIGLAFHFHLRGLIGSEQEFADKRFKGRPGYGYLRGNVSRNQSFGDGWAVRLRAGWQMAGQALVSNEQLAIGGVDTVRGYLESAALGDRGLHGSIELAGPNLAARVGPLLQELRLLAFADAGMVRVIDPITAIDQYTLAGVGLGLRLKAAGGLSASLDWALALRALGQTGRHASRLHARLVYEW